MPIGAGAGAAIAAGATIASTAGSAYAQGKMNKKTRKWNEKMHALVREESLADWAMQNEYNSPQAQMQRYRDAGLNPNLIYGQSNEAPAVRSSDVQSWSPRAPNFQIDAPSLLMTFQDLQLKEASLDNLRTQNTVQVQEALLKAAQTANLGQQTAKSEFDLQLANELKQTSLETAQANLRKINTETDISLQANERQAASNSASLQEAAERILKIRAERQNLGIDNQRLQQSIENLKKDSQLKQLDIDLKEKGVQPNDNLFFRILSRILEKDNFNFENLIPKMPKLKYGNQNWKNLRNR